MSNKDTFFEKKITLNCKGKILDLSTPKVMGILNVTPNSFFDGGKYTKKDEIKNQIEKMINEDIDIIDVGAISSKPNAKISDENEELKKLIPALEILNKYHSETLVSVDTYHSGIAKKAVNEFGVCMINDISAGNLDNKMFATIAKLNIPYIIMHMQGTPETMQNNPRYDDIINALITFFTDKIAQLKQFGINDVIIDPGFGFGKTVSHNYEMLRKLQTLKLFELPLLTGMSRKSMINRVLDCKPENSLNGTTVVNTMALMNGANILRVHDVKEAVETVKIFVNLNSK